MKTNLTTVPVGVSWLVSKLVARQQKRQAEADANTIDNLERLHQLKQWGIEHRQPHSSPFACIFPYFPCLASARLRHLRKNPKQKSLLWGAAQF